MTYILHSIRSGLAISVLLGILLITGCSPRERMRHKRETGRHAGTGVPTKMLSKLMVPAGKNDGAQNQGIRVFDTSYTRTFEAVQEIFAVKEYLIRKRDMENGFIETSYRTHTGLFALGFLGSKTRSKMIAEFIELEPEKTKVTLTILVEKAMDDNTWQHFPISDYDLDLIDSDSIEIYFSNIAKQLKPHIKPEG